MHAALHPYRAELGLSDRRLLRLARWPSCRRRSSAVVADERVPVFSFTFGIPPLDLVREAGAAIVGTATTVAEAVALEQAGVDLVVVQGSEAGGHRGTFAGPVHRALVGLVGSRAPGRRSGRGAGCCRRRIMDGRGIAAALALGQSASSSAAPSSPATSGASEAHKRALTEGSDDAPGDAHARSARGRGREAASRPHVPPRRSGGRPRQESPRCRARPHARGRDRERPARPRCTLGEDDRQRHRARNGYARGQVAHLMDGCSTGRRPPGCCRASRRQHGVRGRPRPASHVSRSSRPPSRPRSPVEGSRRPARSSLSTTSVPPAGWSTSAAARASCCEVRAADAAQAEETEPNEGSVGAGARRRRRFRGRRARGRARRQCSGSRVRPAGTGRLRRAETRSPS